MGLQILCAIRRVTPYEVEPDDAGWLHEIKFDGYGSLPARTASRSASGLGQPPTILRPSYAFVMLSPLCRSRAPCSTD
jgi:hypothetical protein